MPILLDFLLHSDKHLLDFVATYGPWVYAILFAIVFAETGFIVTPFLPGDSLLFAVGALCAMPSGGDASVLNPWIAFTLLVAAAFAGDTFNYTAGRIVGPRVIGANPPGGRIPSDPAPLARKLINPRHVERAHEFFVEYGGKAVVLARFVPIVRTFLPFVAGAALMSRHTFIFYNLVGGVLWVSLCMGAGFLFGNVPIVKENFSLVALGIVIVSLLPMVVEYQRNRYSPR